mmetsp:Transcript_55152/g.146531  ORF Transcript_55152/g.146531 Transcript_55152/m.146531 type:complete len:261 (-) Transcript_55152:12-794(-)
MQKRNWAPEPALPLAAFRGSTNSRRTRASDSSLSSPVPSLKVMACRPNCVAANSSTPSEVIFWDGTTSSCLISLTPTDEPPPSAAELTSETDSWSLPLACSPTAVLKSCTVATTRSFPAWSCLRRPPYSSAFPTAWPACVLSSPERWAARSTPSFTSPLESSPRKSVTALYGKALVSAEEVAEVSAAVPLPPFDWACTTRSRASQSAARANVSDLSALSAATRASAVAAISPRVSMARSDWRPLPGHGSVFLFGNVSLAA